MDKMVTIKDVAKRARVSIATVSRIINGADNVGESYRTAVQKAIKELDYQPDAVAQSMKKKTFRTIGLVMSDFSVPFFGQILKQIEKAYRSNGELVLFVNTYEDPAIEKKGIQFMVEKRADVLIISSTGMNEDYLSRLQEKGMSIILLDRRSRKYQFPSIYVDKKTGMYQALEYLREMGHREIAFISGPRQLSTNYDRYSGISDFCYDNSLPSDAVSCYFGTYSEEYGYKVTEGLLKEQKPVTAIVVGSVTQAAGVVLCCKEQNIRIPEDISLVSFGEFSLSRLIEPRLTHISDGQEEIGRFLIGMIQDAFEKKLDRSSMVIEPRLILHQSVRDIGGGA